MFSFSRKPLLSYLAAIVAFYVFKQRTSNHLTMSDSNKTHLAFKDNIDFASHGSEKYNFHGENDICDVILDSRSFFIMYIILEVEFRIYPIFIL